MSATGREAAVDTVNEQMSAKHELRLNTGLSASSTNQPINLADAMSAYGRASQHL